MRGTTILALASLLAAGPLRAAKAADALDCTGPESAGDLSSVSLGAVTGGKVAFLADASDKAGCPSDQATCKKRAFLLDNNQVVYDTKPAKGGYVCATFIDPRGRDTTGWLPAASVKPVEVTPSWFGTWKRDTSSQIAITRKSDLKAALTGDATWGEGAGMNIGHIDAIIDPTQQAQDFATDGEKQMAYAKAGQYDCAVKMKQLGPYLAVVDNGNCGGANVNFSGVYTKR